MRKIGATLLGAVLVPVAVAALLLARPVVQVTSSVDPDVTIRCDGSASVNREECLAWGDEVLALEPPTTTFEMEDLAMLALSRPLLGFGSPCQADYFIQRYPDDVAWNADIPCADGSP